MSRHLAYCQNCNHAYIVETNGYGIAMAFEKIPSEQQAIAQQRRLQKPGSDLCVFGGCLECKKPGWSGAMAEKPFRGLL